MRLIETMKPSYDEIIKINPRLKNRPREKVENLLNTIVGKGFIWSDEKEYFYNENLRMHVRTQGLDLFDSEGFERAYQTWSNPRHAEGMHFGYKYISKILFLFTGDLIFGWIFIPFKIWVITLVVLLVLIFVIKGIVRNKILSSKAER